MGGNGGSSVLSLVLERSRIAPGDVALLAPGRAAATYGDLAEDVRRVAGALRGRGIAQGDRVALVVANGSEAAVAFLAISSVGVCAPLNPAYREAELEFFLRDLRATAVIVDAELDSPVRDVARTLGIDVLDLIVEPGAPAGRFGLGSPADVDIAVEPEPDAEALVLHTSGTTARPKIVPLTHRQLLASARNVAVVLGLGTADRCLNVMPLFHIHGIVAALLASIEAGGSVVCTPGFHQVRFFEWLRSESPTWTSAVPTMYQSVLERVRRDPRLVDDHGLRFLRSSSAALPVSVMEGLEQAFRVPVLEAYGMTEAAHQMASNPLPPGVRKPGSVGLSAGPQIGVLDSAGDPLPAGEIGEVAVSGENVFSGYESAPETNAQSFVGTWFRTGDQGRLDDDGYLFLLGRLKEIINRAGEKVSPAEIDEVILRHPAVAQAVTFGMPDERLGEEIAAAVVVRAEHVVDERQLQDFVAQTVAPFKVPRRIVFVDDIPKGATGKVQRVSLSDRLRLDAGPSTSAGDERRSEFLENELCRIWADVLGVEAGPSDDFFALGGDSILGAEAVARARDLLGKPDLPLIAIVRAPTPRAFVAEVESQYGWNRSGVVPITAGDGSVPPLFLVHGVDGDITRFAAIARLLGPAQGVYGLRAPGHEPGESFATDVSILADQYLEEMRVVQEHGPYLIGAFCMGAAVALELAHRLAASGERAALLLVDPRLARPTSARCSLYRARRRMGRLVRGETFRRRIHDWRSPPPEPDAPTRALTLARESYVCVPTQSPAALLISTSFEQDFDIPMWYLRSVFTNVVVTEDVEGEHVYRFQFPSLLEVHGAMTRALARLQSELAA